jgi:hypothetical protein
MKNKERLKVKPSRKKLKLRSVRGDSELQLQLNLSGGGNVKKN